MQVRMDEFALVEDRSRHASQIMATLRNPCLPLIRRTGATEIAASRHSPNGRVAPLLAQCVAVCHDRDQEKGKTHLRSSSQRPRTLTFGSLIFLFLALALAVASGDVLLVLAVGSAVAGIFLLTMRRAPEPAQRRAAVPIVDRAVAAERTATPSRPRRTPGRMAVRRYRSAALLSKRLAAASRRGAPADANVAEAPGQAQVIQVLQ